MLHQVGGASVDRQPVPWAPKYHGFSRSGRAHLGLVGVTNNNNIETYEKKWSFVGRLLFSRRFGWRGHRGEVLRQDFQTELLWVFESSGGPLVVVGGGRGYGGLWSWGRQEGRRLSSPGDASRLSVQISGFW